MRTRARITIHDGHELCRLDVARSSRPMWANTTKADKVFFARMNNSSRPLPEDEQSAYIEDHWPEAGPG